MVADFLGPTFALDANHERGTPIAAGACVAIEPRCGGYLIVADGHAWVIFERPLLTLFESVFFLCPPSPCAEERPCHVKNLLGMKDMADKARTC